MPSSGALVAAAAAVGGLAYAVSGSGTAANSLRGKVVLITGAGGGVGREAALAFARRGAHLVLWDLSEAGLAATKGAVAAQAAAMAAVEEAAGGGAAGEAAGGKPAAVPGVETGVVDISSREEVYGAAAAVQQLRWGGAAPLPVFAVVNNAGIVSGGAPILEADDARVVKTFQVGGVTTLAHLLVPSRSSTDSLAHSLTHSLTHSLLISSFPLTPLRAASNQVNTLAHFWTTKAFLPAMRAAGAGHVVVVASVAGLIGSANLIDYSASKFAAVGFAESLRNELYADAATSGKVGCSLVCPAHIKTALFKGFRQPLIRSLEPAEVAEGIVRAVEQRIPMLVLPRVIGATLVTKALFPSALTDWINTWAGTNQAMSKHDSSHADKGLKSML